MAAHRYWRANRLGKPGTQALELSEFQLLSGTTRVDASATLTASVAPTSGLLSSLNDDDLSTVVAWAYSAYVGLTLSWDFGGSPQDVTDIRLGSSVNSAAFLRMVRIQYSDDGVTWFDYYTFVNISWPGASSKTISVTKAVASPATTTRNLLLEFEGTNGQTTHTDSSPNAVTVTGVGSPLPALSNGAPHHGTTSLVLDGVSQYLNLTPLTKFTQEGPGWTFEAWVKTTASSGTLFTLSSNQTYTSYVDLSNGFVRFFVNATGISAKQINDGQWHHIAVVMMANTPNFSQQQYLIYVDGEMQRNYAGTTGATGTPNLAAWLGAYRDSSNATARSFFAGTLKDVMVNRMIRYTDNFVPFIGPGAGPTTIKCDKFIGATFDGLVTRTAGATPLPAREIRRELVRGRKDYYNVDYGRSFGRVSGSTKDKGTPNTPVSELVRLYRERDGLLLRATWSDPATGAYTFDYVDETLTYTVVSYDHDKAYRAVLADGLTLANGGVTLLATAPVQAPNVFLRSQNTALYASAGAANMIFPTVIAENDLLLVVMQTGTPNPNIGSNRWTLQGVQQYIATGGVTRYVHVYTTGARASDANQADTVSFSVSDRSMFTVMAIGQTNGKRPVVTAFASTAINTTANQTISTPDVTTGTGERLGIAIGASSNALGTPALTTWSIAGAGPWTPRTTLSFDQMRMAVWTKPLIDTVLSMAATITTDGSTAANNGLAAATVIVSPAP